MIKHLILNNLVLVESCEIHFAPHFNVVTGETGAGKTALIEAIALTLGGRADSSLIRKGCDRAFVEVCFDIQTLSHLKEILEDAGLELEDQEDLIIRRELSKEGKNRAFINCRMVPLPLLQKVGAQLIDMIGQHAHQALRSSDSQRSLVDLFGDLQIELKKFQNAYTEEKLQQKKVSDLQQLSLHKERDEDTWRFQLEEIDSAALKQGEEEEAFEKYQKLAHAQELSEKIDLMLKNLSESSTAILPQLGRSIKVCDALTTYDKALESTSSLLHEAHIALSESVANLQSYAQNIDNQPNAFTHLENRLNTISRLKRKYGQSFDEIQAYRSKIQGELFRLENLTEELKSAELALSAAKAKTDKAAIQLTSQRHAAAKKLQILLTKQLQQLNMIGAEVNIAIVAHPRTTVGDDSVQFWLKANTGEHPGLVQEHSSGGELSRLLFAIKIALAEKNNTPTLIFDEIDANVGGRTATIIGEELKKLGKHRQVICITHFPQVASKADTHLGVQKVEEEGRTLTQIQHLSKEQRQLEILRMMGGREEDAHQLEKR